ncbi:MAG: pre-peptidase C-terminal domain-containing protein [Cyanobacteria bacterium SBLK]|nr:pre-peptidase C-terminal domain-containing protein [Cyanobacteria bacterium SBLK]
MFIQSCFARLPILTFLSLGLIASSSELAYTQSVPSESVSADLSPLILPLPRANSEDENENREHENRENEDSDSLTVGQSEEENNSEESQETENQEIEESDRTPLEILLELINREREKANIPPLQLSSQLGEAAQSHAEDMAANDFVTPVNPRGIDTAERVAATGYTSTSVAENLGINHAQPQDILEKWLDSPGYRLSLLDSEFTEAGLGYANNPNSRFKHYWSLVLAIPGSNDTAAVAPVREIVLQVEGELSEEDPTLEVDGSRYDRYSFEGKAGQMVLITLESNEFDTYLFLFNGKDEQIANSDDISDENSNSRVTMVLPQDDTYTVIVNSYSPESRGRYKVSVETEETEAPL